MTQPRPPHVINVSDSDPDDVHDADPVEVGDDDVGLATVKGGGGSKKKRPKQVPLAALVAPAAPVVAPRVSKTAWVSTPAVAPAPAAAPAAAVGAARVPPVNTSSTLFDESPFLVAGSGPPPPKAALVSKLPYYDVHQERNVPAAKEFRKTVWQQTAELGAAGAVVNDKREWFDLTPYLASSAQKVAKFTPHTLPPKLEAPCMGHISVQNVDCLLAAQQLAEKGYVPLVADAGSRNHFGGNYKGGARAQEEEMCRRSTLAFAFSGENAANQRKMYPLAPSDAIYVPDVVVFREGVRKQYKIMPAPFRCAFGIIAATSRPPLDPTGTRLIGDVLTQTRDMIRSFYLMAAATGHRALVIVPVGCGAFANPASHLSLLFRAPLLGEDGKPPLRGYFDEVCFAILEDHNSMHRFNPDGNLKPFAEAFAGVPNADVPTPGQKPDGGKDEADAD